VAVVVAVVVYVAFVAIYVVAIFLAVPLNRETVVFLYFRSVFWAGVGAVALEWAGVAMAVAVDMAIGFGLGIWYRAREKTYWLWVRFLSILAFPWFCWFPIVFGFTSFALYHRLSWGWRPISLFWLVVFGFCAVLWIRGKKLEEKARNPLRGILEGYIPHFRRRFKLLK
jgi:hypothetical protein